jgi:lipopolysaccharide transport system ATP-binding protein
MPEVSHTEEAIIIEDVVKSFKKTAKKSEYSTFKSELVRLLTGKRRLIEPSTHIEALKGLSLTVKRGSTTAIIGRNGSGKSTLLKLVTGIYTPTSGTIKVNGRVSALLELGAGFHPDFTGRENIFINGIILGMSRAELKNRVEDIIRYAELGDFIDEPVRTYSSGMFMRLAFAVATHVDPEILIIDEILSVGDEHFQRKSEAKMNEFRKAGKTILLVTHSLGTVESWCDSAAWIDGGKTRLTGAPAEVVREYRRAVSAAESQDLATGHSALSEPGLALPETATAQGALLPKMLAEGGIEKQRFASGEKGRVTVDTSGLTGQCEISVRLQRQGHTLFEVKRVQNLGARQVSLELELTALAAGPYQVQVSAMAAASQPWQGQVDFEIEGETNAGLLALRHSWLAEP